MDLKTIVHRPGQGWSEPSLPDLDSERTLIVAFGAADRAVVAPAVEDLRRAYPRSHLIGCSTAGEIHGTELVDDSLVVAVARFAEAEIVAASVALTGPEASRAAGEQLARRLARPDVRAVIVLSDGLGVNGTELVAGLRAILPEDAVISGGLAADGDRFADTWVLDGAGCRSGAVCAVALCGDGLVVGHGSEGGWDLFGPERRVTRSDGNVLFELDGRPALALYQEYLGERAAALPASGLLFPLCLRRPGSADESVVRTILGIDEDHQSLTFAGDVPAGHLAQLMRASTENLIDGAARAGENAALPHGARATGDLLAILVSCVGRRLVLGERSEEEIEATLGALPAGAGQVGFYSYGEIAPTPSGRADLHNQTMTLVTLAESGGT